ncbi:MAG: sulfate/molybdate ABC transporter ATP-binding protein [Bdellovibrionia bacterium]
MSLVTGIHKKYDDFSLEVPSWEILDQGVTALIGASGSGKTTLFRILLGLEDGGKYSWEYSGTDLALLPAQKRNIGVVFQSYDLFPHMTVKENILFAADAKKIEQKQFLQNDLALFVERLQLSHILDRKADVLSGGEKQRTALARALVGKPRILFLDEPFSALDANLRGESRSLVLEMIQLLNIPAVLVTHDQEDVKFMANKVSQIEKGHLKDE